MSRLKKSTIVRIKTALMRAGFGAAEWFAPRLGARFAERLWFRLPPRSPRLQPDTGTPFGVVSDGHVVRGRRWGQGPVVYLVHGWGGDATQLGAYVDPLVAAGFTVVTHDAPSHGRSDAGISGVDESNALEFARAVEAVVAAHGPAHAVIAHSMGAMATMLALREGGIVAERLVFVAPMTKLAVLLDEFGAMLGFGPRTRRPFDARLLHRVGEPVEAFDMDRLTEGQELPLLVVHDQRDQRTDYRGSAELVSRWPDARLVPTSGLGHQRILRDPKVVRTVSDFVVLGHGGELQAVPA